jgi:hypothetical protein
MFGEEIIDDEDLLLSSPKILVTDMDTDEKEETIVKISQFKEKSDKNPSWDDF